MWSFLKSGRPKNGGLDFSLVKKMMGLEGKNGLIDIGSTDACYLHLGCGGRLLPGFVNVDFLPEDSRVVGWNLLDPWPENLEGKTHGIFSEDVFEHFFYEEQMCVLCEANISLVRGGINRILMPNFDRVVSTLEGTIGGRDYWKDLYAVDTPVDIVNAMLRHSGHRWLHNSESLAVLAAKCGFEATSMNCSESTDPKLSGINLRSEIDSLSFATDLKSVRSIQRMTLTPSRISNAILLDEDEKGSFYRSTSDDPMIFYEIPDIATERVVLINVRCFNVAPPFEHNVVKFYFGDAEKYSFFNDRSLLSTPYNNFVQGDIVRRLIGEASTFGALRVDPVDAKDATFYAGKMDIYFYSAS